MPTKPSRVFKFLSKGLAIPKRNKLGMFYIQLTFEPKTYHTQKISIGIDPGSMFTGISVQSQFYTHCSFNLNLPGRQISKRLEERSVLRRTRRGRRIDRSKVFQLRNHRQKRFSNREGNSLPPSIYANKNFELRVIRDLISILPVSEVWLEWFSTSKSKGFTVANQGQKYLFSELQNKFGKENVNKKQGYETSNLRTHLGLKKDENKASGKLIAHCTDSITLACFSFLKYCRVGLTNSSDWLGKVLISGKHYFANLKRLTNRPRKLHLIEFTKGGVRKSYGGFNKKHCFRNGDIVQYKTKKKDIMGIIQSNDLYGAVEGKWKRLKQIDNNKNLILKGRQGNLVVIRGDSSLH